MKLNKCISTLFKNDSKDFFKWYNYYKKIGIDAFILYYNGKIDKFDKIENLDCDIIKFINQSDNIILFEWDYKYSYDVEHDSIIDELKQYYYYKNNRIANAQLQSLNHCLYLLKPYCEYLLICDFDEFFIIDNIDIAIEKIHNVPDLYFNNIFSKITNNNLICFEHENTNNYKYIVNPKKVSELHIHGFLQNQIGFSNLLNDDFFFCSHNKSTFRQNKFLF